MMNYKKLISLEKKIDKNFKAAWYQNGLILMKIRDTEEYKKVLVRGENGHQTPKWKTFEDYLEDRWEFSRRRGYQLLDAANLTQKIAFLHAESLTKKDEFCVPMVHILPLNERQIRPLLNDLKTDSERVYVWQNAVYDSKGERVRITADYIQNKVNEFIASGEVIEDMEFNVDGYISDVHVSKNSGDNEWYTPKRFIDAALATMGAIDLDPASSERANKTVGASRFYTAEDSGLNHEWHGNVWLNPPYAQPLMSQFADKLITELPKITSAIVLCNNGTETKWFQSMAKNAASICFPSSRIKFVDQQGNESGAPLQGQAFLYFGTEPQLFIDNFSPFGLVVAHA
jgi:phage N-6-adenine-methyltransferase